MGFGGGMCERRAQSCGVRFVADNHDCIRFIPRQGRRFLIPYLFLYVTRPCSIFAPRPCIQNFVLVFPRRYLEFDKDYML